MAVPWLNNTSGTGLPGTAPSRPGLVKDMGSRIIPSLRYLCATEVHAYAFSIAANVYLTFFPFTII